MTALDTNVLVRFLVRDDEGQARLAKALIERLDAEDERGFVSDIVLCELVWVLGRGYRFARGEIVDVLRKLTVARQLAFTSTDSVLRAIVAYEEGAGDFADYFIREQAKAAGCDLVATFDTVLHSDDMFSMP